MKDSFSLTGRALVSTPGAHINYLYAPGIMHGPHQRNLLGIEKKMKTTYDISLDSQISLLPLGFSLRLNLRNTTFKK